MSPRERLLTAVRGGKPDRVPFTVWHHFYLQPPAGSASEMANAELAFYDRFHPDLLKVMHDVPYEPMPAIERPSDWRTIPVLSPESGNFGAQLYTLSRIRERLDDSVPMIDTVFGVYHYANEISNGKLLEHLRESPGDVHVGLSAIALSLDLYARATLEVGCEGIYYALSGASFDAATYDEYREHFYDYDRQVLTSVKSASLNILHLHGYHNLYFDLTSTLPAAAICWSDRAGGPSLSQAREMYAGCLMSGLDETKFGSMTPEAIIAQGQEAISEQDGRNFILSPGCSVPEDTSADRIAAIAQAALTAQQ